MNSPLIEQMRALVADHDARAAALVAETEAAVRAVFYNLPVASLTDPLTAPEPKALPAPTLIPVSAEPGESYRTLLSELVDLLTEHETGMDDAGQARLQTMRRAARDHAAPDSSLRCYVLSIVAEVEGKMRYFGCRSQRDAMPEEARALFDRCQKRLDADGIRQPQRLMVQRWSRAQMKARLSSRAVSDVEQNEVSSEDAPPVENREEDLICA